MKATHFLLCEVEDGGASFSILTELTVESIYGTRVFSRKLLDHLVRQVDDIRRWADEASIGDVYQFGLGVLVAVNPNSKVT